MALEIFLHIDGIEGDCETGGHEDDIIVTAYEFETAVPGGHTFETVGSGGGKGRVHPAAETVGSGGGFPYQGGVNPFLGVTNTLFVLTEGGGEQELIAAVQAGTIFPAAQLSVVEDDGQTTVYNLSQVVILSAGSEADSEGIEHRAALACVSVRATAS